jgi:hypothetical protein
MVILGWVASKCGLMKAWLSTLERLVLVAYPK